MLYHTFNAWKHSDQAHDKHMLNTIMSSTLQKHMQKHKLNSPKLLRGPEKSPHTGMDIARIKQI